MESLIAEALHEALSVLSPESHAAVVFMLEDRYGVKLNGLVPVNAEGIQKGLTDLLGPSAGILFNKMNEYIIQHSADAASEPDVRTLETLLPPARARPSRE